MEKIFAASGVVGFGDSTEVYAVSCEMRKGVVRHVYRDYDKASEFVGENGVKVPIRNL